MFRYQRPFTILPLSPAGAFEWIVLYQRGKGCVSVREVNVFTGVTCIFLYPIVFFVAVIKCDAFGLTLALRAVFAEGWWYYWWSTRNMRDLLSGWCSLNINEPKYSYFYSHWACVDTNILCRWTGSFHDRNVIVRVIDGHLEMERESLILKRRAVHICCPHVYEWLTLSSP